MSKLLAKLFKPAFESRFFPTPIVEKRKKKVGGWVGEGASQFLQEH